MTEENPMHGSEVSSSDFSPQESSSEKSSHTLARRSALSLIGAGLAFLSTGSASATPGKGNANQPWYEWNADVDANGNSLRKLEKLETNELVNTAYHDRSEWSTETLTFEVGSDFPTLQESVYAIPFVPYESVEINIPSGMDLSDEDVIIPQTVLGTGTVSGRGYEHKIKISGDEMDPSNCPVGSLVIAGVNGGIISVDGVEFQRPNPYADDGNGVSIFILIKLASTIVRLRGERMVLLAMVLMLRFTKLTLETMFSVAMQLPPNTSGLYRNSVQAPNHRQAVL